MTLEHAGSHYGVQYVYNVDAELWQVELCEAMPVPKADRHLLGAAFATAVVSDADPRHEAVVRFEAGVREAIPFPVLSWYLEAVAAEVERCRAVLAEQGVRRGIPRQDHAGGRRAGSGRSGTAKGGAGKAGGGQGGAAKSDAPAGGSAKTGDGAPAGQMTGVELVSAAKAGVDAAKDGSGASGGADTGRPGAQVR
ncbi:hypothetical protein [Actinosynnema pretiosum]|uniref:Uncharacterized protein n=1 Tax=Actinosynnema pretiosum TaxID=42197 RepID=A0A290Z826_9PSEU|nr:hypothetical protein [Actinosynnema pretiosum]ATE55119.1 hypothetical protein CNX65_19020 [Actinosynnema pretiosum]